MAPVFGEHTGELLTERGYEEVHNRRIDRRADGGGGVTA
jgi:hypothetical protein